MCTSLFLTYTCHHTARIPISICQGHIKRNNRSTVARCKGTARPYLSLHITVTCYHCQALQLIGGPDSRFQHAENAWRASKTPASRAALRAAKLECNRVEVELAMQGGMPKGQGRSNVIARPKKGRKQQVGSSPLRKEVVFDEEQEEKPLDSEKEEKPLDSEKETMGPTGSLWQKLWAMFI